MTSDEEAEEKLREATSAIDDMLQMMKKCPYNDVMARVGAVLTLMQNFSPEHFEVVAAVSVERLSQFLTDRPMAGDVPNAEDFLLKLISQFIISDEWGALTTRDHKIQAMARGVFETCTPSQSALLSAVAMMRLTEFGQGPTEAS